MTLPERPKTLLTNLTQLLKAVPTHIRFSRIQLKPNAQVPELRIQSEGSADVYPLLGDRYLIGRSSQASDIVVRNPLVSQVHASVLRRRGTRGFLGIPGRRRFELRDEDSTNGLYRGKRRLPSTVLYHKDVINLGPPELEQAVQLQYIDPPAWYLKALRYGLMGLGGVSLLGAATLALVWQQFSVYPLPNSVQGPVIVYARDGQTPLSPLPPNRSHIEPKSLSEFSAYLPKAVMASEDARFNWHVGVDPIGTLRAVFANLKGGGIREGGSTLTQQLARNLLRDYVGTDDSSGRKLKEAAVALKLEMTYSKSELMRIYLGRVYLGYGNFGFEDAAQFYFGKTAKDLDLSEAATLAGILPGPNAFNPVKNYQSAVEYRNRVLNRMAEQGMVSPEEAARARRSRIDISPKARETLSNAIAPYYYSQVLQELNELLGEQVAKEGNFVVATGLDPRLQAKAEAALADTLAAEGGAGISQGALATMNFRTGEILAAVGGADYGQSQFNRVTQAERQPGSTFKIFTYTAALEKGISPSTPVSCAPLNWDGQDFGGCNIGGGSLDLYKAVAQSENPVALRVAQAVGLDTVVQTAHKMGITSKLQAVPGLVLGQSSVRLIEMVGAFGVLANQGVKMRPRTIQRVWDSSDCTDRQSLTTCRVVYSADQEPGTAVIAPATAATMTTLLQGVIQSGTGRAAALGLGEAGKTGTTNNNVDLWFVGYIPSRELVTGVWLGNDDNRPTSGSSAIAAQLWGSYMRRIGS